MLKRIRQCHKQMISSHQMIMLVIKVRRMLQLLERVQEIMHLR